jgi:adenylate cyclase
VYLVFSVLRHLQTEREQRWIRKAFSSYVSPKLVRELVENPDHLRLTGERRELTCLFTDLEGFTSLIERSEPTVILPVLNAYLDGMIRIAFAHDGTVDKIVGDALHIIFGAPIALPDHGARAVACALDLDRFAQRFAEDQRRAGIPFGRTRIGVNSGIATVGNFGGEMRFDYTAHGDVVNTAARLEGANKALGTRICISGTTVALCPGFSGRPAGALVLKGKSEATEVFEPLPPDRMNGESLALYLTAFERMRAGDACARDALAQVLKLDPGDPLAAFHLRRLGQGETGTRIVLTEK